MTTIEFIALVLATGAIIEVWHKGSIFADKKAYIQAQQDATDPHTWRGRFLELLLCPLCQSYHVPIYVLAFWSLAHYFGGVFAPISDVLVFGLAATRASNIINGLLPNKLQYVIDPFEETN